MNQSEKTIFLNKYTLSARTTVEFVTETSEVLKAPIPEWWKKAFITDSWEHKKEVAISQWEKYLSKELSNTILYLKSYLANVELIKIGKEYSILYTILGSKTKREFYYIGKVPVMLKDIESQIEYPVEKIDISIVNFYTKVHNGFNDYTSKSMGLDYLNVVEPLSEYDWEYADKLDIDLDTCYNFFSNGMGTYVVVDLQAGLEKGTYLWSTKELPRKINFWDVIDEWIVIGLDF